MNSPANKTLLLSIHPRFAEMIFSGSKTVELRRVRPRVEEGDVIVMYVTSPIKAIQGFSRVRCVRQTSPSQLWDKVHGEVGVSRSDFDAYFQGTDQAVGIHIETSCRLIHSIGLSDIRDSWDDFHPPQSFRYLSESQLQTILSVPHDTSSNTTQVPAVPGF